MANGSDITITTGLPEIPVVAKLDENKSYNIITNQLAAIKNKINAQGGLSLNLNVIANSNNSSVVQKLNEQLRSAQNIAKPISLKIDANMGDYKEILKQLNAIASEMATIQGFDIGKLSVNTKNGAFDSANIQYYKDGIEQSIADTIRLVKATKEIPAHYEIARKYVEDYASAQKKVLDEQDKINAAVAKAQNAYASKVISSDVKTDEAERIKLANAAEKQYYQLQSIAQKEKKRRWLNMRRI